MHELGHMYISHPFLSYTIFILYLSYILFNGQGLNIVFGDIVFKRMMAIPMNICFFFEEMKRGLKRLNTGALSKRKHYLALDTFNNRRPCSLDVPLNPTSL